TSYGISVSVSDKDGAGTAGSTNVTVNNVVPTNLILTPSASSIDESGSVTLTGNFLDPGTLDTHSVVIHWGDGSADTTLNLGANVLTFSTTHTYQDNPAGQPHGSFAITATLTDKD